MEATPLPEAKPLTKHTCFVLKQYAKTLPGRQRELAGDLDVHYVTLSKWLHGAPCSQWKECENLAQHQVMKHPEWGDDATAETIAFVQDRLSCTPEKARAIASMLSS